MVMCALPSPARGNNSFLRISPFVVRKKMNRNITHSRSIHIPMILYLLFISYLSGQVSNPDRYYIGSITIVRDPVFEIDNATSYNLVFSMANKLHILTKTRIIQNELLFHEGDVYDHELVEETERNLRKLDIIGEEFIRRDTINHNTINLAVHTRDKWSTELGGGYKQEGGIRTLRMTAQDHNFLGNAQRIKLSFNQRSDRDDPEGMEFTFYDRRLLGTWWEGLLQYKRAEELDLRSMLFRRRFYTEAATWAASANVNQSTRKLYYYYRGERIREFQITQHHQTAWFSVSSGDLKKLRLGAAIVRVRTQSDELPLRPAYNLDLVCLSISPRFRRYYKERYLNNFGRTEDVPVGYLFNILVGKNFYNKRQNTPDYYLRIDLQHAFSIRPAHYLGLHTSLSSFLLGNQHKDMTLSMMLIQHTKLSLQHTFTARLISVLGHTWSPYRQVTLGAPNGLRGYQAHALTGQRLLLLNLEDRIFTPLKFWIFHFGFVMFFDLGAVWKESDYFDIQKLTSSFGVGLRIENAVQQGSGILRIDFAFRPDKGSLAQISITTDQLFKSFLDLNFISPNAIEGLSVP